MNFNKQLEELYIKELGENYEEIIKNQSKKSTLIAMADVVNTTLECLSNIKELNELIEENNKLIKQQEQHIQDLYNDRTILFANNVKN